MYQNWVRLSCAGKGNINFLIGMVVGFDKAEDKAAKTSF
jgi:hypothetical protein